MVNNISFNVWGVHSGTNFNISAGAKNGEFCSTEVNQNNLIQQDGTLTPAFYKMRSTILAQLNQSEEQFPIPAAIPTMAIDTFFVRKFSTIFDQTPMVVNTSTNPLNFEQMQQN